MFVTSSSYVISGYHYRHFANGSNTLNRVLRREGLHVCAAICAADTLEGCVTR
jgi:hypothetical protein